VPCGRTSLSIGSSPLAAGTITAQVHRATLESGKALGKALLLLARQA